MRNRCFNNRLKQTTYFAITGKKPNLSNMRVFGSECYAYKQNKKKLDPRYTKGILMGYDKGSPAYLVYIPETGKIFKYRIVKFPRKGLEQKTQTDSPLGNDDFTPEDAIVTLMFVVHLMSTSPKRVRINLLKDLRL